MHFLIPTLPAPSPHLRLSQLLCGLGEVKDVIYDLQGEGGGAVPGIRVSCWVKETIKQLEETIQQ